MSINGRLIAILITATLLAALLSSIATAASKAQTVNEYLVITPDSADEAAEKLRTRTKGEATIYHTLPDEWKLDGVWVLGGVPKETCVDSNVAWEDIIVRAVTAAETQISIDLDYPQAQSNLRGARLSLKCLREPAQREVLWKMYFLEGIAEYFSENEGKAQLAFTRALAVKPNEAYGKGYPTQAKTVYVLAQEKLLDKERAFVVGGMRGAEQQGGLFLDGLHVEEGFVQVFPGEHLVQIRDGNGNFAGAIFSLASKDVVSLSTPKDMVAVIPMLPTDAETELTAWLIKQAQTGAKKVAIHDGEGNWYILGQAAQSNANLLANSSKFLIGLAGGYHYTVAGYGSGEVTLSGRIVAPLYLTGLVRFGVSEPVLDPNTGENLGRQLFPVLGLGVEVRWDWPVGQNVGVRALFGINPDGSEGGPVLVGVAVGGGIDIPLGKDAPVFIRLKGEFGFMGKNMTAFGGAGFGFRFK